MPWPNMLQRSTRFRHFLVTLPLLVALGLPAMAGAVEDVQSVPQVDLGRYLGLWYEIAGFPMFFQRKCLGDTTAEYSGKDAATISVRNRCRTEDGFIEAEGRATVVPETGNGRLFRRLQHRDTIDVCIVVGKRNAPAESGGVGESDWRARAV